MSKKTLFEQNEEDASGPRTNLDRGDADNMGISQLLPSDKKAEAGNSSSPLTGRQDDSEDVGISQLLPGGPKEQSGIGSAQISISAHELEEAARSLGNQSSDKKEKDTPFTVSQLFSKDSQDHILGSVLEKRYHVEEMLGAGGMSVVYKARQLITDRFVAVKTLHIHLQENELSKQRFQREIQSLCKLSHPNIITIIDCVFDENGQPFVVMDFLDGQSFDDVLLRDGPIAPRRAIKIFLQICEALIHAHKKGIFHRDLKPSNIMFLADGDDIIKVVDFGLAKLAEANVKITRSGEIAGTPLYMSPEQWKGDKCDGRSDIYSFGAVMYETLTGTDVFTGQAAHTLLNKHLNEKPRSFKTANAKVSVPEALEAIVMKALEKEPEKRFQTMSELRNALTTVYETTNKLPQPRLQKSITTAIRIVTVLMIMAIAVLCGQLSALKTAIDHPPGINVSPSGNTAGIKQPTNAPHAASTAPDQTSKQSPGSASVSPGQSGIQESTASGQSDRQLPSAPETNAPNSPVSSIKSMTPNSAAQAKKSNANESAVPATTSPALNSAVPATKTVGSASTATITKSSNTSHQPTLPAYRKLPTERTHPHTARPSAEHRVPPTHEAQPTPAAGSTKQRWEKLMHDRGAE